MQMRECADVQIIVKVSMEKSELPDGYGAITPAKAKVLEDLKEAVDELNLVLSGKLEARDADDLLNELR